MSPSSFAYDEVIMSDAIVKSDDVCPKDPPMFDCVSTKHPEFDWAKVSLNAHVSSSITKDELYVFSEAPMSDYCRFA